MIVVFLRALCMARIDERKFRCRCTEAELAFPIGMLKTSLRPLDLTVGCSKANRTLHIQNQSKKRSTETLP